MNLRRLTMRASAGGLLAVLAAGHLPAQDDRNELIAERIHAPLPLYTFDWEDLWPRNFHSEESFGCESRVAFGDWRFTPAETDEAGQEFWYRFNNYGAFHCAVIIRWAGLRNVLDEVRWDYGFFVRIGRARHASRNWELWAIQKGNVPGSEYVLLAREAGPDRLVESFRLLQQRCPSGRILEARGLDIWPTRYCSIRSRSELLALARRMLRLPPRGTIARVAELEESSPDD